MLHLRYNVDTACWLANLVVEFVYCCCSGLVPNAPPKIAVDRITVAIVGSDGVKALAVAPVLLMADGILPSSTPSL